MTFAAFRGWRSRTRRWAAGNTFEAMYEQSVDSVLHGTGNETFEAVKMLRSADPEKYTPAPGANYPRGRFGDSLRQVAQLIKANLGVEVAFADIGGWDHHVNEGQRAGTDRQPDARVLGNQWRLSGPIWVTSWRRHSDGHHVRVRTHRARERQPRHRPRPCQRGCSCLAGR